MNDRLRKELDVARTNTTPRRSGRRVGRRHGRHGHRHPPTHIDETIDVPLPTSCPECGGGLTEARVADQIQDETAHGVAIARARLFHEPADLLNQPVPAPSFQRFAAHLAGGLPAVVGFLFDPTVDAINCRAERALRPAVVNPKGSGGNPSLGGAETQQILASVIHTAGLRNPDARAVLVDLLRARQPIPSPATCATPQ